MATNSINDFTREFKAKVVAPLKTKLESVSVKDVAKTDFLNTLENDLPGMLYSWITSEQDKRKTGVQKYAGVFNKLIVFLEGKNLGKFVPIIAPAIETSVRMLYRNYVESFFDKYGLEDLFETWLGIDLDSDEDEDDVDTI